MVVSGQGKNKGLHMDITNGLPLFWTAYDLGPLQRTIC